jgi:heme/copper-type cytochrome/quinol oxidase subunit 3
MKTRFRALDLLCKLQVFMGLLVIAGGVIFLLASIAVSNEPGAPPTPKLAEWMVAAIVAGLIFLGLQIIATAQVFQCLTARGASLDSGNEKDYGMHRDDS